MLKKILLSLLLLVVVAIGGTYYWLNSLKPQYSGEVALPGLAAETKVYFDKWGIPHIYASNSNDAYRALGYVVAQDRLFQLEMIRRLAGGTLSEVIGKEMLKSDKFFRAIGLNRHAAWSADEFTKNAPLEIQNCTNAYIEGVNTYITEGKTPIEFTILGIEPEPFKLQDVFLITGYMALGFAEGFRIDPMVESMYRTVGEEYMRIVDMDWSKNGPNIPVQASKPLNMTAFSEGISEIMDRYPVSPWIGSNSWVLAPKKTKNKKTILCNDAHMGYTQPAVWYEAHIEYPGFRFYGNHLAGFPFALTGHSDYCGNGLTMFENDDVDFYIEEVNGSKVKYQGAETDLKSFEEVIKIKGGESVNLTVRETPHGPLIQDVFEEFPDRKKEVAIWWTYLKFPTRSLEAVYNLNHAKNIDQARLAVSMIEAPGLNVMYGDREGHIAWWAAAKLVKRASGVNPKRFLNGATGTDDPIGWLNFSENPQSEDPENGYVYSANNQPDSISIGYYPGYYTPGNRAATIVSTLDAKKEFTVDDMKRLLADSKSSSDYELSRELLKTLASYDPQALKTEEANRLSSWEGDYGLESPGAIIMNRWLYNILASMMVNKIGKPLFKQYMNSHFMKTSYPGLIRRIESPWWDDWATREKEFRAVIIKRAWQITISELRKKWGKDQSKWKWGKAHTLEHVHPIGRKKPFHLIFNVGPESVSGGNEVINNMGSFIDSSGTYPVRFGPSMRRIIDFSDTDHSLSILPTGQSGYFMADHYSDQAHLFNSNGYRQQLMERKAIEKQAGSALIFIPVK
jgi:penicillin G amidase